MRLENGLRIDFGVIEQAIGGQRLVPTAASRGNTRRGAGTQSVQYESGTAVEPCVAEGNPFRFRGQGAHERTPNACRKSPVNGRT